MNLSGNARSRGEEVMKLVARSLIIFVLIAFAAIIAHAEESAAPPIRILTSGKDIKWALLSNLRIGSFNHPGPISRNSLDDGRDPGRQDRDQPSFQRLVFGCTTMDNHAGRCCVLRRLPRRHVWRVTQDWPIFEQPSDIAPGATGMIVCRS